jgi:hypothetical protein
MSPSLRTHALYKKMRSTCSTITSSTRRFFAALASQGTGRARARGLHSLQWQLNATAIAEKVARKSPTLAKLAGAEYLAERIEARAGVARTARQATLNEAAIGC